jgi:hypothetical protein
VSVSLRLLLDIRDGKATPASFAATTFASPADMLVDLELIAPVRDSRGRIIKARLTAKGETVAAEWVG